MMRPAIFLMGLLVTLSLALPARAQDLRWVQIEAKPSKAEVEDRARAWEGLFQDVAAFATGSGWYVIALGPYSEPEAQARRAELLAENLIPGDSFIADGAGYGALVWPAGATLADLADRSGQAAIAAASPEPSPEPTPAATATTEATVQPDPALPDETPDQARASEAALSQSDREDLQRGLMWFGFYASTVDGAFGRGTRASMAAWQEANGMEPTGILTTAQRATLLDAYRSEEQAFGFQTVTEAESGIEASLPLARIAFDRYEPPFVHYASADGDIRLILISQPGDQAALSGLYDTLQTLRIMPASGPRALDGKSFTLRGESADRVTEAYAATDRGVVKGWLLSWNPQTAPDMPRALSILKASFRPIGDRALDPGLVPLSQSAKAGLLAGLEVKAPRLSRSGFYVDARGSVLTTSEATASCARITLDGMVEARVTATDPALGLALLTPATPLAPATSARFTSGGETTGTELAVAGYSYEDRLPAPVLTFGTLAEPTGLNGEAALTRLAMATLPGDTGGPVLTGSGSVAGVLLPAPQDGRQLPQGVAFAAKPAALAALLQGAGITPAPAAESAALTPQDLTALAQSMTVLVSCWD